MKSIGIGAIVVGILVIVLGLMGAIGQGGNLRTVMVGAAIMLAVGVLLYRRKRRGQAT